MNNCGNQNRVFFQKKKLGIKLCQIQFVHEFLGNDTDQQMAKGKVGPWLCIMHDGAWNLTDA